MKSDFIALACVASITGTLLAFTAARVTSDKKLSENRITRQVIACMPDRNTLDSLTDDMDIPPIPGAGAYSWNLRSSSDSARFYFDQGINTYYSFHIIEALASFKKAARFDSTNAMMYWAEALAYGPNINDVSYATAPAAVAAVQHALAMLSTADEKETMLIRAMEVRYSTDSSIHQSSFNRLYADKMKEVYQRFPDDADVAALYADALMLLHPWDLWAPQGTAKAWTPEIRQVLESLLRRAPQHPGANHYYIHVMEPSPYAELATPSADILGQLTPGLSHTLHMPSHIYLRTGNYQQGIAVNENALARYEKEKNVFAPAAGGDFLYNVHNRHMLINNAMLAGNSAVAMNGATGLLKSVPMEYLGAPGAAGNYIHYLYMTPVFVNVRFAKWNELINAQVPADNFIYANLLYHWGKGMALANTSRLAEAKIELGRIDTLITDGVLREPMFPFSAAVDGATVAQQLLKGTILLESGQRAAAIAAFQEAVATENGMVYNEPRDWLLSPAHYLGQAYLEDNQPAKAAKVFLADLENNRENAWALAGLLQASESQSGRDAASLRRRLKAASAGADVVILKPVL